VWLCLGAAARFRSAQFACCGVLSSACAHLWRSQVSILKKTRAGYSVCRCGQSRDKPLCDKTHEAADFNGTETASRVSYRARAEELQGSKLALTDARDLCSHVDMCLRAGGIRDLILHSDGPEARRIALEEVTNCNSALMASKKMEDLLNPKSNPQSQWSKSH